MNCLQSEICFQVYVALISYPGPLQSALVSKNQNLNISMILSCATLQIRAMTNVKGILFQPQSHYLEIYVCEDHSRYNRFSTLPSLAPFSLCLRIRSDIHPQSTTLNLVFIFSLQSHSFLPVFIPPKV